VTAPIDDAGPARLDVVGRAEVLAAALAPTAAERDRARAGGEAEVGQLKASGLLAATAGVALGGLGLRWTTALEAVRVIARVDNPTAMLLGYHWVVYRTAEVLGAFSEALASCIADGSYMAGVTNARNDPLILTPDGAGYRLDGRKTFCTGARVADLLFVSAQLRDDHRSCDLVIPAGRPGIRAARDWDAFGERSSESGSVSFDAVEVGADELRVPSAGDEARPREHRTLSAPLIQLLFVNLYLGAAQGALADAVAYARSTTRPWPTSGVSTIADDPYVLETLGYLTADLRASQALADEAARLMDGALAQGERLTSDERAEVAVSVYAAKLQASRVALHVTERVFEVMGARSTSERYGFDRRWRDVRVHTLHDPIAYKAKEVGAWVLAGTHPVPSAYS
jgi:alkylation response protein AidB-like acyl-CoA dehydrogenase